MNYEDTNQLKEQYLKDLSDQKTNLGKALKRQNIEVTDTESLEDMVNKIKDIEGTPTLPYYCFAYCESNEIRNMLKDINFAATKNFSGMFLNWSNVNLTSMNTMSGESFSNFIVGTTSNSATLTVTFGENNDFTKAKNMDKWLAGNNGSYGTSLYIDHTKLKEQVIEGPVSLNSFLYAVDLHDNYNKLPVIAPNVLSFLDKLKFKNVTSLNGFGLQLQIPGSNADSYKISTEVYQEVFPNLLRNIETKYITSADQLFDYGTLDYLKFTPDYVKEWDELLKIYKWFNYYTHVRVIDLSKWTFKKVTQWYDIAMWGEYLEEVRMGTNPNPTLTKIEDCFGWGMTHTADFSGWNFGGVNYLSRNFYNNTSSMQNLYWGYDFGKAFTEKTSNLQRYSLDFSAMSKLTHDSAVQIISCLYDLRKAYADNLGITGYYSQLVDFSATTIGLLTPEEIAVGTAKGWSIR